MSTLEPAERTAPLLAAPDATLEAFVETHYPRLVRLAGLVCDDASLAQDAVQAGLERAWRKRSTLAEPDRLSAWLDRIVVREAIRANRRTITVTAPRGRGSRCPRAARSGQLAPKAR